MEGHYHAKRLLGLGGKSDENTGRDLRIGQSLALAQFIVTRDRGFRARTNELLAGGRAPDLEEGIEMLLNGSA